MRLISPFVMSSTSFRAGAQPIEPRQPDNTFSRSDHLRLSDSAFDQGGKYLLNIPDSMSDEELINTVASLHQTGHEYGNKARALEKQKES